MWKYLPFSHTCLSLLVWYSKGLFLVVPYFLSCTTPLSILSSRFFHWTITFMQMTHNFASLFIHLIFIPILPSELLTFRMLYNRSPGWLLISWLSTLPKLNFSHQPLTTTRQDCPLSTTHAACNLGFIFDEHLTILGQIFALKLDYCNSVTTILMTLS